MTLAVLSSHPVQYHAPVYRCLQTQFQIPLTVIYGSDFSVSGYLDKGFSSTIAWDTDLLSGYESVFLSRVGDGGASSYDTVTSEGAHAALRAINPRAVLLLGYGSRFDRGSFMAARWLGKPLLLRAETTDHALRRLRLKQAARDALLRVFYRQFAALLYIGKRSQAHYLRLGVPDSKLVFSPYCVDIDPAPANAESRARFRAQLGLASSVTVLLFSGKLVSHKGPDVLIDAYSCLPDEARADTAIVFVGNGEMRAALEDKARTCPRVRFVGFQNQTQLGRYYANSDLLVMPSESETWGLVVNEALMYGLPCVVSDQVGCAPDLIQPSVTGEVYTAGSVDGLAAAILRGIELCGKRETSERCRQVVSAYSVARAAEGIAAAYQRVIG